MYGVTAGSLFCLIFATAMTGQVHQRQCVVIVVGAPGEEQYGEQFNQWADRWQGAAEKAGAEVIRIGPEAGGEENQRQRLHTVLAEQAARTADTLWLVLIGHGTFDGQTAKFNLRGPDVAAAELAQWLAACKRPLAVVNCASASGPFINRLSGPDRVIVTATKSGFEYNFARFGQFLAEAIDDPAADLDKDQQISLLEAFLAASAAVREFYAQRARLATEHALIDDNGDRLGTPADWFHGVQATRLAKDGAQPDGTRANQIHLLRSAMEQQMPLQMRRRRDQLELQLARLRQRKAEMDQQEYYEQLQAVLVPLARLYQQLDEAKTP